MLITHSAALFSHILLLHVFFYIYHDPLPGRFFFTEEDFKRFNKSSLSKAMRQLLVVLRHVGRISTLREPGSVVKHVLA